MATIIISLLAIGLSLAMLFVMRLKRRKETSDEFAYGDWPHLPEGLAAPGNSRAGGGPGRPSAAVTRTKTSHTAHDGKATSR